MPGHNQMSDDRPPPGWVEFEEIRVNSPVEETTHQDPLNYRHHGNGQKVGDSSPRVETVLEPAALTRPLPLQNKPSKEDESFKNGKVVVSVFPENTSCAWLMPPRYNPYSMPAILASQGISMLPDHYITALEMITNDYRFRSYSTLYGRLIALWMSVSLAILLVVLFSSPQGGLPVLIFCFTWCGVVLLGILGCCLIRKQIRIGLRHAVQSANKLLLPHNLLAGVEDRGQISCHKVVIHLVYFKTDECLAEIERQLRIKSTGGAVLSPDEPPPRADVADSARGLVLKYSQGYVKDSSRNRILFPSRPALGVSEFAPKHCQKRLCLCQYVQKQHFDRRARKWWEHFV